MSPITGRLFDRYGAKWLTLRGLGIVTITTFLFTNLSPETTFTYLTVVYAIRMFGLALTLMPVMTSALNQLPPTWYSHDSALASKVLALLGFILALFLHPPKKERAIVREIHGDQPPMS